MFAHTFSLSHEKDIHEVKELYNMLLLINFISLPAFKNNSDIMIF